MFQKRTNKRAQGGGYWLTEPLFRAGSACQLKIVTGFVKRGLILATNFSTLKDCNSTYD